MADTGPKIYQFARGMTMADADRIMMEADLAHAVLDSALAACKVVANPDLPLWFRGLYLYCSADMIDYMVYRQRQLAHTLPPPSGKLLGEWRLNTKPVEC